MMNRFRIVSMLEGVSFLLLLFVAMPAKYQFGIPEAVTVMGWAHGFLFMAYVYMAVNLSNRYMWSPMYTIGVVLAGMIPFACFVLEMRLKRDAEQETVLASS